ncbi:MAG: beta-lactamase family protein [Oscillospiraceae bacterium]|nr:beta-lactamase family protein [Oscillospiraceae bacterium]
MLSVLGSIVMALAVWLTTFNGWFFAQPPLVNNLPDWVNLTEIRAKHNIVSTAVFGSSETSMLVYYAGAGAVVYEEYRRGFNAESVHSLNSATKSFLSTMVGMLIYDGYLDGVHQLVYPFFPEADLPDDCSKRSMTLHHLLTMRGGLPWIGQRPSLDFMLCEEDSGLAAFLTPQRHEPGARFVYDGGAGMQILLAVMERATGQYYHELLQARIFDPMGMTSAHQGIWTADGRAKGGAGLYMTTRDLMAFGLIYLYDGVIDGVRVLPEGWVEETLLNNDTYHALWVLPYNLLFWGNNYVPGLGRSARAQGFAGQLVSIYPDSGLVVARTGGVGLIGDGTGAWPLIRRNGSFLYLLPTWLWFI